MLLAGFDRLFAHIVFIDQFAGFFFQQHRPRGFDGQCFFVGLAARHLREHLPQLLAHVFHPRRGHDVHADVHRDIKFHFALVQLAGAQLLAQFLAGGRFLRRRLCTNIHRGGVGGVEAKARRGFALGQQRIKDAIFSALFGLRAHLGAGLRAVQLDGGIGKITDDLFDVLADITDFGKARGFHLHKRRIGERGQPACDFGFAHTGGADHQNIFWHHLIAQFRRKLRPPPAVAQGNRHRALGRMLADDVAVEFGNDLARGHGGGVGGDLVHVAGFFVERSLLRLSGNGSGASSALRGDGVCEIGGRCRFVEPSLLGC